MTNFHEIGKDQRWLCNATMKRFGTFTVQRGLAACGHCMRPIVDAEGQPRPYSMGQLLNKAVPEFGLRGLDGQRAL